MKQSLFLFGEARLYREYILYLEHLLLRLSLVVGPPFLVTGSSTDSPQSNWHLIAEEVGL